MELGLRFKKGNKMSEGEKSAGYVDVEIDLDDEVLLRLALEAHKRNITLNKFVNDILKEILERETRAKD